MPKRALYLAMNNIVPHLTRQEGEADPHTGEGITKPGDFTVDEKSHQVFLTEQGHESAERILTSLLGANASSAAAQPQQPFDPRRGPMPVRWERW